MDRAELERLDRTTLIAQAEALGVARANILTRPELMDELLVRTAKKDDRDLPRARGFFGRARDLVAKVIEKGLHLPDAADRLRQVSAVATQIAARVTPAVVPTVTLAEIYAAQGHRARAIDTLRRVLELEPDHRAAQSLLTNLEMAPSIPPAAPPPPPEEEDEPEDSAELEPAYTSKTRPTDAAPPHIVSLQGARPEMRSGPEPRKPMPPPESVEPQDSPRDSAPLAPTATREPAAFIHDDPLPMRYDVDECVAIAVDPTSLYVYWEVRESTLAHVRSQRRDGTLCLRLLVITPSWDGPRSTIRDFDVDGHVANRIVRDLPAGAVVRAAIGWRTGEIFLSLAHAPPLETPPGTECPVAADEFVRWTPRGMTPVTERDSDYPSITRALGQLAPRRDSGYGLASDPVGSSDLSAGFSRSGPESGGGGEARPLGGPSSEAMI